MPIVSVVIPYHKKRKFFVSTLKSVLNQSFQDFEVIIIYNDFQIDDLSFIKKIIAKNKKISLLIKKKKLGAGIARNIGIHKSKGKFIAFLDADDIWKKSKLKKQIKFMQIKNLDISHTAYKLIKKNQKNKILRSKTFVNHNELLKSCNIGLSTVIVRKKILTNKKIFFNLKTHEDFLLWLNLLKKGYKIGYLEDCLTSWRQTQDSLSSGIIQKLKDAFTVYNKFLKFNLIKSFYFLFILSFNSLIKKI